MSEQRLIDASYQDKNLKWWLETNSENGVVSIPDFVVETCLDQPTIDPETLPIVKELRAKLAEEQQKRQSENELYNDGIQLMQSKLDSAEEEKQSLISALHECVKENGLCNGCKNWNGVGCADEDARYFCEAGGSDMWEWKWRKQK